MRLSLVQGDLHMSVTTSPAVAEKMGEIAERSPKGQWANKEVDLFRQANEEIEAEYRQKSQQNQQPENPNPNE